MGNEGMGSVEVDLKNKTAKVTGNDIITVLTCLLSVGIAVMVGMHYIDSKESRVELIGVMKENAKAMTDLGAATREQNCLLVNRQRFKPEEYRELQDFCRR